MSKFGSKEEIIEAIAAQFSNMKHAKMSIEELDLLVEQTRELYERSVVLRFKAYEEKIFGEAKEILNSSSVVVEDQLATEELPQTSEEIINQENLPQDESFEFQKPIEETPDIQEEGEAIFDFSLFDEPVIEPMITSSEPNLDSEQTATEIEEVNLNEYVEEVSPLEKDDFATQIQEPSFSQEEIHAVEFTNEIHAFNETPIQETISDETTNIQSNDSETDIFKNILSTNDDSIAQRLMQSKLITLIGAFGFNEKFQCIQELFNGSSDDFNQAIDVLDNLSSFEEAKEQLQFYVRLNNWDLESEITGDFVRKIERRFR